MPIKAPTCSESHGHNKNVASFVFQNLLFNDFGNASCDWVLASLLSPRFNTLSDNAFPIVAGMGPAILLCRNDKTVN